MPDILIKNLSFSYSDRLVFNHFSLSITENGIYTLIGPSGSGKTTLFRLLLGLAKPVIKAHGNSDARAVKNAVRQAIAYVQTGVIAEIEALALREEAQTADVK